MASRDVWKHGSARHLHDLLASALLSLLLPGSEDRPVYFASPWMSDFTLFENGSREVAAVFPELADRADIRFVEYLGALCARQEVRIITSRNRTSDAFVEHLRVLAPAASGGSLRVRLSPEETHEKGILAPGFYIDGSMNITHRGVHVNGEKITYHAANDAIGASRVASAYLEFGRRWSLLVQEAVRW
jgi:hypothetical protein